MTTNVIVMNGEKIRFYWFIAGIRDGGKKEEFFVSAVEGKEMFSQNIFEMEMLNKLWRKMICIPGGML